jgi:arsenite methyltransferase
MALLLNRMNAADYRVALRHLDARPGETVLELGFGGGHGVATLLDRGVKVVASEPAVAMRARAHRRFHWALADGRLDVWPHAAEELPATQVDRALSMNTVYFWRDVEGGFANLQQAVRKRVVLGIADPAHLRDVGFESEGFRVEPIDWYADKLRAAGFDATVVVRPRASSAGMLVGEQSSGG